MCSMNGALAFVDTSDCTMMNIAEHYMASDVEWDPTGRYVVTSVSWWSHKVLVTPSNQTLANISTITKLALNIHHLSFSLCGVGGQCLLAVDVPGPSSPEEQQGPLLSAALETQATHPTQRRPDQGTVLSLRSYLYQEAQFVTHCEDSELHQWKQSILVHFNIVCFKKKKEFIVLQFTPKSCCAESKHGLHTYRKL